MNPTVTANAFVRIAIFVRERQIPRGTIEDSHAQSMFERKVSRCAKPAQRSITNLAGAERQSSPAARRPGQARYAMIDEVAVTK